MARSFDIIMGTKGRKAFEKAFEKALSESDEKPKELKIDKLKKEWDDFKESFNMWGKKVVKDIKVKYLTEVNNFIIYKETKKLLPPREDFSLPPLIEITNSNLVDIENRGSSRVPNYSYYKRSNGERIYPEDMRAFLVSMGALPSSKKRTPPEKKVRVITKVFNIEKFNNSTQQLEVVPGWSFVDKVITKAEFNEHKQLSITNKSILSFMGLAKLKSCQESIALFGYKNIKNTMLQSGELFQIMNVHQGFVCKIDGASRNIIEIKNANGKLYKFLLSEIELVLPDIERIKSWGDAPKDRKIKESSQARLVRNKKTAIPHNAVVKVEGLQKIGGKEYAQVTFENKNYIINKKQLKLI